MNSKIITIEGYVDERGDFDMGIFMCKPVLEMTDGNSVEAFIEDYCIDVHLGDEGEDDDFLDKTAIMKVFYKIRKKDTINRSYWKCVVEVNLEDNDDWIYKVIWVGGLYLSHMKIDEN